MKHWIVYTDGSAIDNANIDKSLVFGGWAWAIKPKEENKQPETFYAQAYKGNDTTNNKMELMAILDFLTKAQKKGYYTIRTDSSYAITSMAARTQRMASRIENQLFLPSGQPAKNSDLLIKIYEQITRLEELGAQIEFEKVKGHSGDKMNQFVDDKATAHAQIWKTNKR